MRYGHILSRTFPNLSYKAIGQYLLRNLAQHTLCSPIYFVPRYVFRQTLHQEQNATESQAE